MEPKSFKQLCEVVCHVTLSSRDKRTQLKVLGNASHANMKHVDRDAFTACTDVNMWIMLIQFRFMESPAEIVDRMIAVVNQIPKHRELQEILLLDNGQHRIYDWCQFGAHSKLTKHILNGNKGKVILACNEYRATESAF